MKKASFFSLTLLLLTLFACSANATPGPEGEWALVSYNGIPALPNVETSISFGDDGHFGGNVGCNGFGAEYKISGDQVTFDAIISTAMYCEATAEQESAIIAVLSENPVKFHLAGETLSLTSADASSVIMLARK